jgi:hypothetical protein
MKLTQPISFSAFLLPDVKVLPVFQICVAMSHQTKQGEIKDELYSSISWGRVFKSEPSRTLYDDKS